MNYMQPGLAMLLVVTAMSVQNLQAGTVAIEFEIPSIKISIQAVFYIEHAHNYYCVIKLHFSVCVL